MIIRSRPSRAEIKRTQLNNMINGQWGREEPTIEEGRRNRFNSELTKILIVVVGVLAFIVMIIGFCRPLVTGALWGD